MKINQNILYLLKVPPLGASNEYQHVLVENEKNTDLVLNLAFQYLLVCLNLVD